MNELIEKLKDKNYVKAFGLMKLEERICFAEIGRNNCEVYCKYNIWSGTKCGGFEQSSTYAIKSDYQPEPLTRDIKIVKKGNWLGIAPLWGPPIIGFPNEFLHLHCIPSMPNFAGFWYSGIGRDKCEIASILTIYKFLNNKTPVFARLRK